MTKATVDFSTGRARIFYDPSVVADYDRVVGPIDMLSLALAIEAAGYSAIWGPGRLKLSVLKIEGMTCGHCTAAVQTAVERTKEAHLVRVSLDKHECYIIANRKVNFDRIVDAVEAAGYLATLIHCNREVTLRIHDWVCLATYCCDCKIGFISYDFYFCNDLESSRWKESVQRSQVNSRCGVCSDQLS